MRFISAFLMGAAFIFAVLVLFPWMKSNLEISPAFRIEGGSGELAADKGTVADGAASEKVASKASADSTKSELEEQLAAAAERSRMILERERSLERTFSDIRSERGLIDNVKQQIESQLIDKLSERALSDGSMKSKRRLQDIAKASPNERRRLMVEAYQQMTPEGLAEVVQDLARDDRTESAVSVMSVLEDRKAARVLALVAEPQPTLAASLTEQLRGAGIRIH